MDFFGTATYFSTSGANHHLLSDWLWVPLVSYLQTLIWGNFGENNNIDDEHMLYLICVERA